MIKQTRPIKMWVQHDVGDDYTNTIYILRGIPYTQRKHMVGWQWVRGINCRGGYITHDPRLAHSYADYYKVPIDKVTW